MTESPGSVVHTSGVLTDYFAIESLLLSTRSADAYKAYDKSRQSGICLWMLRHALALNSPAVRRFLVRMEAILRIEPAVTEIASFGVDAAGVAFAVAPSLSGHSIDAGNLELREAERRFGACIRLVDRLHAAGIICGDICQASFWVDGDGDIQLIGVMGSFDGEAATTAAMPPLETLHFVAPEQRSAGGIDLTTDVFALGVLGYKMLTGKFPYGEDPLGVSPDLKATEIEPLSTFIDVPPVWGDAVLQKCLDPDPTKRFPNAGAVLRAIAESRERAHTESLTPVRLRRDPQVTSGPPVPSRAVKREPQRTEPTAPQESSKIFQLIIVLLFFFVAIGSLAWLFSAKETPPDMPLREELEGHVPAIGEGELKDAVRIISQAKESSEEQKAELEKLANSDDPLAHQLLVRIASEAQSDELRELAEKAIIDRARRLNLLRSADQVRQWLRSLKGAKRPDSYQPILRSLDTTLPPDARNGALRQAYATSSRIALKLAVALALDTGKFDEYQQVVAELVGDSRKMPDASSHSTLALIMSHPELALIFGDDVVQKREELKDPDVLWVLGILAERGDTHVRAIAGLAVQRKLLNPLRAVFIASVRDTEGLSVDVLNSLVRAAQGSLRVEDIASFGRWDDRNSEKILLVLCADSKDPDFLLEAFDILAGKSLGLEPGASLVEWVRRKHWDNRGKFAHAIGVLSNLELVDIKAVEEMLSEMEPYIKDNSFVKILVNTKNSTVLEVLLEKHANTVGFGVIVNMLSNPSKKVRIDALRALEKMNLTEILALKLIIDNYEREKDEEVKKIYYDSFWVIRERVSATKK